MKIPSYLFAAAYPGIYCFTNKVNHRQYIGSSKNLYDRLHNHRTALKHSYHENIILQNSVNKRGVENLECSILAHCDYNDDEQLKITEQYYVDLLNPYYNITKDVIRNTPSESSKKKMSKSRIEGYKNGTIKKFIKSIDVYDTNGIFIKSFESLLSCSEELNIHVSSIIRVCNKIYKQIKGYVFRRPGEKFGELFEIKNTGTKAKSKNVKYFKRKIVFLDTLENKELTFESIASACKFFEIASASIWQIRNSKNKIYKKRYKLISISAGYDKK